MEAAFWLSTIERRVMRFIGDRYGRQRRNKDMLEKRQEAEKAAYKYCCACEVGPEREQAFEIYERIRNATRLYA